MNIDTLHKNLIKFIAFILMLFFCSPAYSVTLPLETKEKKFLHDWNVEVKLKQAKQRVAMRCLAYYRPNEAAWEAYIAQEFGDRYIPVVLWDVWRQHEASFLEDELPYDQYPEFKILRKKFIALGGYPDVYKFKYSYNLKWLREQIAMFEILNPLWRIYENLSGEKPKPEIMFDIKTMLKAIENLSRHLALARSVESDNGSSTANSDEDVS